MTVPTNSKVPKIRFKGFAGEWEEKKLGEIASVYQPQTISQRDLTEVGFDVYGANGIIGKYSKFNHKEPQIAVTCRGNTCGTVNFTKEKSWITGNAMVVNVDENEFVAKTFLFQQLSSQDLSYLITGSGQPQITGTIKSHGTWLCDINEQTQIGGYFREVDRLIGMQERKHDKLVTLKKAMLQKMFPQPGTTTPEIRFKGFSGDWDARPLRRITSKVTEKNVAKKYSETFTNSAEFGIISQRDYFEKDISNADNIGGYYIVEPECFVYNPRISELAPVGPVNRNKLGREGIMSPLYTVFRTREVDNTFLEYFFNTNLWHPFMFLNGDTGARADRFSIKDAVFTELPVPYPDRREQQKIGQYFRTLDELISRHALQLQKLKQIKAACLEKMFV